MGPTSAPRLHGDERRFVEDHVQTAQKLTVYREYVAAWINILAVLKNPQFNNQELYIVDTHAGAGRHASREHPDHRVFGTPLIAAHAARRAQRKYGVKVRVIAIEKDARWVTHLRQRTDPFVNAPDPRDRVEIRLINGDFADQVDGILEEATARRSPSLWLVDPYGLDIPFEALAKLQGPRRGPEVIVNLDLLGIWRVGGALAKADERAEDLLVTDLKLQEVLRRLYGTYRYPDFFRDRHLSFRENIPQLAHAYAERFERFEFRRAHLLYSTRGQARALIHLCHAPRGAARFREIFERSQDLGLLADSTFDHMTKAHSAVRYREIYAGQATPIDQLYEEGVFPYSRRQIKSVCVIAEEDSRGTFDETTGIMHWAGDAKAKKPATEQSSFPF